jgi:hypothetical protein
MRTDLAIALVLGTVGAGAAACNPPPIVDEPASALDVTASFIDVEEQPADGKLPVVVQFFKDGVFVELDAKSTVECNSTPLTFDGLGYAARVPIVASGGMFTIAHSRDGMATRMTVTVPARPVIDDPAAGSSQFRSQAFMIAYQAGAGKSVRPGASGPAGSITGADMPDNGAATIDASGVGSGMGSVSITRDVEGTVNGTGFASAKFTYAITRTQRVVWQ